MPDHVQDPLVADLVLEGGGVLGIAHVGALTALEDAGYRFARVAGTSAGSIVGAFVAAGMPAARMAEIMQTLDYRRFTDKSLLDRVPIGGPLASLLLDSGVYEGDAVREWVGNILADECDVETFGDLTIEDRGSSLPTGQQYKLVVTATDVTRGQLVRFPWDYRVAYGLDPDTQLVADAVRASISIPFFYEPATITGADGTRSTLVDGGVLSNFPIDTFDRTDDRTPRWPTFGVKLLPELPAEVARRIPVLGLVRHGPVALAADVAMTAVVGHDQAQLAKPWVSARTMRVDTAGVNPVDFGLSREQADGLFASGRASAEEFLSTWDWEAYLVRFRVTSGRAD